MSRSSTDTGHDGRANDLRSCGCLQPLHGRSRDRQRAPPETHNGRRAGRDASACRATRPEGHPTLAQACSPTATPATRRRRANGSRCSCASSASTAFLSLSVSSRSTTTPATSSPGPTSCTGISRSRWNTTATSTTSARQALVRDSRRRNAIAAIGWLTLVATAEDVRYGKRQRSSPPTSGMLVAHREPASLSATYSDGC